MSNQRTKSFLCFLGIHKWAYFAQGYGRRCRCCWLWQYRMHSGPWISDVLGTASTERFVSSHRWFIKHKKTGMYLGACHTTGDGLWTTKEHAESWVTYESAKADGMHYHPFQKLKESAVDIVLEPE